MGVVDTVGRVRGAVKGAVVRHVSVDPSLKLIVPAVVPLCEDSVLLVEMGKQRERERGGIDGSYLCKYSVHFLCALEYSRHWFEREVVYRVCGVEQRVVGYLVVASGEEVDLEQARHTLGVYDASELQCARLVESRANSYKEGETTVKGSEQDTASKTTLQAA